MQATHNLYYTLVFTCSSTELGSLRPPDGVNLYNIITIVPSPLRNQEDPSDSLATLDIGVRRRGFRKRERTVDKDLELTLGHLVDQRLDHVVNPIRGNLGTEENTRQAAISPHQRTDVDAHRLAPRGADHGDAAAITKREDAPLQSRAADGIDDEIDALVVGELHHRLHEIVFLVIDAVVETERF